MLGLAFYTQILFAFFLVWATTTALYMGVFHGHRATVSCFGKQARVAVSLLAACAIWYSLYSWTYLSW